MPHYSVWAPDAHKVELVLDDRKIAMSSGERGWWHVHDAPAADYGFSLDGGPTWPDPRSNWQPNGVHAMSRPMDHCQYTWHDQQWQGTPLSQAIIYELHVGTFTPEGTFDGVITKLDHLVDLGISHIELMPVNEFSGRRGWGYDGAFIYAPHSAYGGPAGLKRLVDACHIKGLGVILDVVYNHFGPEGGYAGKFAPYLTDRYRTPWGEAVNLDGPDSDTVRKFFIDNAIMWLSEYHADGLRIDAVHAFMDTSAVHFLEQLAAEVAKWARRAPRPCFLIGESDLNDPRVVRRWEEGGFGLDAQWSDDFHHAVHALLTGERTGYYADFGTLADLAKAYRSAFVYDGRFSVHRRRTHGRPVGNMPGYRFVVCLQNHDQVGNRAAGERLGHIAGPDLARVGAAMVLTSPFVPMLFQGEEWAASAPFQYFTSFQDPGLSAGVREGRRAEFAAFGWDPNDVPDPQSEETFQRSKLKWLETVDEPHASMLQWYRQLIALRRRCGELGCSQVGEVEVDFDEQARWLRVRRGKIAILYNLADHRQTLHIEPGRTREILLSSKQDVQSRERYVELPASSVIILGPRET